MITVWALRGIQRLNQALPSSVLRACAWIVSFLVFVAMPRKRANVHRNMRVVLGIDQRAASLAEMRKVRTLAWRSMLTYGGTLLDFITMERLLPQVYADSEKVTGWEHLEQVLATGRGALFVGGHFGHWDLAGAALARRCPPGSLYAVAEEFTNPQLEAMVMQQRAANGIGIVHMDNVRQMVRVLKDGRVLAILVDRPLSADDGVNVRFFGKETKIPAGAAVLALLARCPILPGYLVRRPDGRFEGAILPPIEPITAGSREAAIAATMQAVAHALEDMISIRPDQWFMFRDMWPVAAPPVPRLWTWTRVKVMGASAYRRSGARLAYRWVLQMLRAVDSVR